MLNLIQIMRMVKAFFHIRNVIENETFKILEYPPEFKSKEHPDAGKLMKFEYK